MSYVLYFVISDQETIKVDEMRGRIEPKAVHDHIISQSWVDEQFNFTAKQVGERFKDTAWQVAVMFFRKNIFQVGVYILLHLNILKALNKNIISKKLNIYYFKKVWNFY